ncbi:hypothetical protein D3C75_1264660 [compost metagenome]
MARVAPLIEAGRLVRLRFGNTRNELQLPIHAFWRRQQPLRQAARLLIEQLANC